MLLDRQLSRLSGIDLGTIRYRRFDAEHADRLDQAMNTLEPLAERLAFVKPPFDLENVAASADAFHADLIVLDYIQRIPPPGDHADKRVSVNATMDYLRQFADAGVAVLVVAAVGEGQRQQGPIVLFGRRVEPGHSANRRNWSLGPMMPLSWCPTKTADTARASAPEGAAHATERPGAWNLTAGRNASAKPKTREPGQDGGKRRASCNRLWRRDGTGRRRPPMTPTAPGRGIRDFA